MTSAGGARQIWFCNNFTSHVQHVVSGVRQHTHTHCEATARRFAAAHGRGSVSQPAEGPPAGSCLTSASDADARTLSITDSRPPASHQPAVIHQQPGKHTHTRGLKIEPLQAKIETMDSPKKGAYFIAEMRRFLSLRKGAEPCGGVGSVHTLTGTVALPSPQTGPQGQ